MALVFGALSPAPATRRWRLYQAGEVDYLVATDAIGMGLNLDIDHVAFTRLSGSSTGRARAPCAPTRSRRWRGAPDAT